ncbi:hypothetical protein RRG08_028749 [Elysia crispata]|uniref:Uncharacterized protein n=1 Tax=Elysia crispata TaxID=231223 RepID=A0AAE1DII0_9GAST|nr:hypothetical protein RRG08_028749 [Elysia crispata]
MLKLIWICLALHISASTLATSTVSTPSGPALSSTSRKPSPVHPIDKGLEIDYKTPTTVNESRTVPNVGEPNSNSTNSTTKRSFREKPPDHTCEKLNPYLRISKKGRDNIPEGLIKVTTCSKSGTIVDHTFRFLEDRFNVADCRNRTLLYQKAETLYCSILQTHWVCVSTSKAGRKINQLNDSTGGEITVETAQALLPTLFHVRRAVDFLCRVRRDFDYECALAQLKNVESCIHQDVLTIIDRKGQDLVWSYGILDPCRHLEVSTMCIYETLTEACTEAEASILSGLIADYLNEPQCSLSGGVRISLGWSEGYMILMVTLASKLSKMM